MSRDVASVWKQGLKLVPVIGVPSRAEHGEARKLRVRLPYRDGNRGLIRVGGPEPEWDKQAKCWIVPRSWLDRLARRLVDVFGQCYVIQTRNESEICAPACMNASGLDCECSCEGEHHGSENEENWFVVCDSFACRRGPTRRSVRLIGSRFEHPSAEKMIKSYGADWFTYFVMSDDYKIKIGRSTDVESRIKSLQTSSPGRLRLVGAISGDFEKSFHKRFNDIRLSGEWFDFSDRSRLDELQQLLLIHGDN